MKNVKTSPFRTAVFAVHLIAPFACIAAHAESERLTAMKQIQKITQLQIDRQVVPQLLQGMTDREKLAIEGIRINVVIDERVGRVVAVTKSDGTRLVEISTGFLSLIGSMLDAKIVAVRTNTTDKLQPYHTKISNFLNNSEAQWKVDRPPAFFEFAQIPNADYQQLMNSKNYWPEFEQVMGSTLSFVVAHELGHHIFKHQFLNNDLQRLNEDQADDFAIRVNWMIGNNPLLALDYFMLFTQVEGQAISKGRAHTASACRLEKFLHAGIKFTVSEPLGKHMLENNPSAAENIRQLQDAHRRLKELCEKGEAMPNTGWWFLR